MTRTAMSSLSAACEKSVIFTGMPQVKATHCGGCALPGVAGKGAQLNPLMAWSVNPPKLISHCYAMVA
jgi:hypothetical protein